MDYELQLGRNKLFFKDIEESNPINHRIYLNRVKALKTLVNEFDISNQSQFQNATWAEYFAVLTLALVAEMLCEANFAPSKMTHPTIGPFVMSLDGGFKGYTVKHWAVQTMEAVCYAEQLEMEARLLDEVTAKAIKEEMRARGTKGVKIRNAKYDELHQKVIALYEEKYTSRSNRDAAKRIYDELKDEIDTTLNTDDPEKQLEKVIGRHVKSKTSPVSPE
jgi:hypothetical protein